jgi:demethylmenaquinone methyltransferase / 2-methoxy-6-polyprenyl-1,4-benzoquinol methylase
MKENEDQHIANVKGIFSAITPTYDLLNHLLSGRRDIAWRKAVVRVLPQNASRILDLAAGTGDLTIAIAQKHSDALIVGADFVPEMLFRAVEKSRHLSNIHYLAADALRLPFPDHSFDAVTIAFGLRNILRKNEALAEMKRLVKPGGLVLVLEMTLPQWRPARLFFHWYLSTVLPFLGSLISRKKSAYQYLSASIHSFLRPDALTQLFIEAGLKDVEAKALTFGICYLHYGKVSELS